MKSCPQENLSWLESHLDFIPTYSFISSAQEKRPCGLPSNNCMHSWVTHQTVLMLLHHSKITGHESIVETVVSLVTNAHSSSRWQKRNITVTIGDKLFHLPRGNPSLSSIPFSCQGRHQRKC